MGLRSALRSMLAPVPAPDMEALAAQDPALFAHARSLASAMFAKSVTPGGDAMPYSRYGWGAWPQLMPSTRINYESEAGELTQNAIIMACVLWICRTFPESPVRVMQKKGHIGGEPIDGHPLIDLLEAPNSHYPGIALWQAVLTSWNIDGNAYVLKVRNTAGKLKELWYEPHTTCRPVWPSDGSQFISGYQIYRAGEWKDVLLGDVVHFRNGLDPRNPRKGLSPLASAFREVFTDNEAANYSASLLRNMGIPGVVVSPVGDTTIDDPSGLKDTLIAKFGGDRKGEPLVMEGPTKIDILSFSPEQMNYEALRRIPEERISALIGIPAVVAGLGIGIQHSTYSNWEEARKSAYYNNLLPTHRALSSHLNLSLLPEYGDATGKTCDFDTSRVAALQDDKNKLYTRTSLVWNAGLIMRSEGRLSLNAGYVNTPDDDVYKNDLPLLTSHIQSEGDPDTLLDRGKDPDKTHSAGDLVEPKPVGDTTSA